MTLSKDSGPVTDLWNQIEERLRIQLSGDDSVSHSPEVKNGERIVWRNSTEKRCTVVFKQSECPFDDKAYVFTLSPGQYRISSAINGAAGVYKYRVQLSEVNLLRRAIQTVLKALGFGRHGNGKGDPVIIITG
jgi:hypothetical protein